jgi:hypothetical protein
LTLFGTRSRARRASRSRRPTCRRLFKR